jgi:hypothetical protein
LVLGRWCRIVADKGNRYFFAEHPHERGEKRLSLLGTVSQLPELLFGGSGDRPVRHTWLSNLE